MDTPSPELPKTSEQPNTEGTPPHVKTQLRLAFAAVFVALLDFFVRFAQWLMPNPLGK